MKDSATLAGGYNETGTIAFTLDAPNGTSVATETVTVSGNGTYTTPTGYTLPTTGTVTGTYQWVASYTGDDNNNAVTSENGTEPVSLSAASPTIVTVANPASGLVGGQELRDTATLLSAYYPDGTITFTLFASDHVTAVYSEQVATNGNSVVSTADGWVPTAPGYITGRRATAATRITSRSQAEPVTIR